ncbi:RNA polymerase sigma-70 factor, ECF subfamily [bacterium A37T11]|nr:RNA polymerase sigma-70 factor, ECF subfamily [bacterium A37T11]
MREYQKFSDNELVYLLKSGDQVSYNEIFMRYRGILYQHAYRMLKNQEETEDVLQDVFMLLWQKRESLEISNALSSYLYIAVRNRIFKIFAHQQVAKRYMDSLQTFIEKGHAFADDKLLEKELSVIIEKEVDSLPKKMREAFLLSRENDRSYKEIGLLLDISEKTVRNQVYNAIRILKTKISSFLSILLFFWTFL